MVLEKSSRDLFTHVLLGGYTVAVVETEGVWYLACHRVYVRSPPPFAATHSGVPTRMVIIVA